MFAFANPTQIQKNYVTLYLQVGWWVNPAHHGFNPSRILGGAGQKLIPYWNL